MSAAGGGDPSGLPDDLREGAGDPGVEQAPRRAASARFEVAGREEGAMRDALDPATQSLGEALRLSYRLLQLGIVALVVTFLFSGFQSVEEGDTGVRTVFGAIAGDEGEEQIEPGLQPFWPYPVGDLVVFPQKRSVRLDSEYWFARRQQGDERNKTLAEAIDTADPNAGLRPGSDGSLLTRDGDLAHAQIEAEYAVVDAVRLLRTTSPDLADRVVRAALMQGTVEAASTLTLAEFTETRDLLGPAIRERAQRALDRLDCGIELVAVRAPERIAPLAVQNRLRDVQVARENAKSELDKAVGEARSTLTAIAGGDVHAELIALIREYEAALESGRAADAGSILARLGARMESPDVGGEVARTILRAKAAESSLRARLERDLQRLRSLARDAGGANPQTIQQIWIDAVREVLDNPQAEIFAAPTLLGMLNLRLTSSGEIMQARRDAEIARKKAEAAARESGGFYAPNSEQIFIGRPGRLLRRDAGGAVGR